MKLKPGNLGTLLLCLLAMPAMALECSQRSFVYPDADLPTNVGRACSFENAGSMSPVLQKADGTKFKTMRNDNTIGARAKDRGVGIVTQVISTHELCSHSEVMIIHDCKTGESIALHGLSGPKVDGYQAVDMKYAVGKDGIIDLYRNQPLTDFVSKARKAGLKVTDRVTSLQDGWAETNRYDPFCGCKHYYPDSAGAKL